jgi:hypothetical protein
MPNSQPPVSDTKPILQRSFAEMNGAPNALIGASELSQTSQGVPLSQSPRMQPPPNMLIGAQKPQQAPKRANPMTAAIAQHLKSLPPDKLAQEAARVDYMAHSYGTLARKPDLTFKDVISSAGQAVADGKATPEEATKQVTGLPQDPTALRSAIQQRFKGAIIAAVMLSGGKGAPQSAPPAAAPPNLTQGVI